MRRSFVGQQHLRHVGENNVSHRAQHRIVFSRNHGQAKQLAIRAVQWVVSGWMVEQDHGRTGAEHASFVTDEVVDRFCVLGPPEACIAKLRQLEALGVDQFNIYTMVDDPEGVIEVFGRDILPAFH